MNFLGHLKQFGIACDQVANTVLGGMADETLSARTHRVAQKGYWYAELLEFILNLIFSPIKHNHCYNAFMSEVQRKQLPKEYQ